MIDSERYLIPINAAQITAACAVPNANILIQGTLDLSAIGANIPIAAGVNIKGDIGSVISFGGIAFGFDLTNDFTMEDCTITGSSVMFVGAGGGSDNITFKHCTLTNAGGTAFDFTTGVTNLHLSDNTINTFNAAIIIQGTSGNIDIVNNAFNDIVVGAMAIIGAGGLTIEKNYIGNLCANSCIYVTDTTEARILSNIITNTATGIVADSVLANAERYVISNNTITTVAGTGILIQNSGGGILVCGRHTITGNAVSGCTASNFTSSGSNGLNIFNGNVSYNGTFPDAFAATDIVISSGSGWNGIRDLYRKQPFRRCDFMYYAVGPLFDEYYGLAIASGTVVNTLAASITSNHSGIVIMRSSASGNSGYRIGTENTAANGSIKLGGGEWMECVFFADAFANDFFFGFHNSQTNANPVDGVYARMVNAGGGTATLTGNAMAASANTVTGTSYVMAINTWYRLLIRVNDVASAANFYLYSDAGALLWTDDVASNIPTASIGVCVLVNSSAGAADLVHLDYLADGCDRILVR